MWIQGNCCIPWKGIIKNRKSSSLEKHGIVSWSKDQNAKGQSKHRGTIEHLARENQRSERLVYLRGWTCGLRNTQRSSQNMGSDKWSAKSGVRGAPTQVKSIQLSNFPEDVWQPVHTIRNFTPGTSIHTAFSRNLRVIPAAFSPS